MVQIQIRQQEVSFDSNLYQNILNMKELLRHAYDNVGVICGMEGSGKSELGKQIGLLLNQNFSEKDVVYSYEQFNEWVDTAQMYDVCLIDEFVLMGLSDDALTKLQKELIKKFTLIRRKRLSILLVIPYIFMLRKYFAIARTRWMILSYTKGLDRGYFKFFNYDQKKFLYIWGHKTWHYSEKVFPAFSGHNTNWSHLFLNEEIIEAKKTQAEKEIGQDEKLKHPRLGLRHYETLMKMRPKNNPFSREHQANEYRRFQEIYNEILPEYLQIHQKT